MKLNQTYECRLQIYFMSILLEERPCILAPSQTAHKKQLLRKIYTDVRTEKKLEIQCLIQIYNLHMKKLQNRVRKMWLQSRHVS